MSVNNKEKTLNINDDLKYFIDYYRFSDLIDIDSILLNKMYSFKDVNSAKNLVIKKVGLLLNNEKSLLGIIKDYINHYFYKKLSFGSAKRNLEGLVDFLSVHNFSFDVDTIITLISNNSILENNISLIIDDKELSNDYLMFFKDAYCIFKGIILNIENDDLNISDEIVVDSAYRMYMREIGKIPLLSAEKERELLIKIKSGDMIARNLFVESNLRLVVSIAKRYKNRGLDIEDLVSEGNIGLLKAIDKFDLKKNYRFSTYAIHWIRQSIIRAIEGKSRTIRLPYGLFSKVNKFKKDVQDLENKHGQSLSTQEIASYLNMDIDTVNEYLYYQMGVVSYNANVNSESDTELEALLPFDDESLDKIVETKSLKDNLFRVLKEVGLTDIEYDILLKRNGINESECLSLDKIGKIYNISRERVRQLESRALKKIRLAKVTSQLVDFTDDPDQSLNKIKEFRSFYRGLNYTSHTYKSFLPKKERVNHSKQLTYKSIYSYYKSYTNDQVDNVLNRLSKDDLDLLAYRNDLSFWDDVDKVDLFYYDLLPRIGIMLRDTYQKRYKGKTIYELLPGYTHDEVNNVIRKLNENDLKTLYLKYGNNLEKPILISLSEKEVHSFYSSILVKIRRLLKKNYYYDLDCELNKLLENNKEIVSKISIRSSKVLALYFGFVNKTSYNIQDIANYLKLDTTEVRKIIINTLKNYKKDLKDYLNNQKVLRLSKK